MSSSSDHTPFDNIDSARWPASADGSAQPSPTASKARFAVHSVVAEEAESRRPLAQDAIDDFEDIAAQFEEERPHPTSTATLAAEPEKPDRPSAESKARQQPTTAGSRRRQQNKKHNDQSEESEEDPDDRRDRYLSYAKWALIGVGAVCSAYVAYRLLKRGGGSTAPPTPPPPAPLKLEALGRCVSKVDLRAGVTTPSGDFTQCGEDGFFVAEGGRAIGIADGVGGWARRGISAKDFSNKLMEGAHRAAMEAASPSSVVAGAGDSTVSQKAAGKALDPSALIQKGFDYTKEVVRAGSSTVCVATLAKDTGLLKVANIGDSGLLVIRNGKVKFQAAETNHGWNFPKQLGVYPEEEGGGRSDTVRDASIGTLKVQKGDVVVAATDGVFDNLHPSKIARVVKAHSDALESGDGEALGQTADHIVGAACKAATTAKKQGKPWHRGGFGEKPDDISAVVAIVVEDAE